MKKTYSNPPVKSILFILQRKFPKKNSPLLQL